MQIVHDSTTVTVVLLYVHLENILAMHLLAAAGRPILSETEPNWLSKFLISVWWAGMRLVGDSALNSSHRKSKRE